MKKKIILFLSATLLVSGIPVVVTGQSIIQTGGTADWTHQYDTDAGAFHTVFRDKGTTVWNSDEGQVLANNGLAGADPANDYTFDTLTIQLGGLQTITANGNDYWVTSRSGSSTEPDVGIRTRLGHAFDTFSMTLDLGESSIPANGDVAIFAMDDETGQIPEFRLETATGHLAEAWNPQGHSHWHWGFTEQGNYSLVFQLAGDLTDGGSAMGTTTVNFEVVPEPATVGILLGLGVLGAALIVRRRRS